MGDVLTQAEIDALLAGINNGDIGSDVENKDEKKIRTYDFARPAKFSKEHLRTLNIIFENYGRLLSTNLPAYVRKNVQIEVLSSEALTYSEFSNALSNPILLGIVNVEPLDGSILIELAENLGFAIIDRMLGGTGKPLDKAREFSEIELTIVERILNICVNLLREPWENVVNIEPRLERIETNSQFAQIISPGEMTSIVTLKIKIENVEGFMTICLPYTTLEPIIDKLNTKYWYSTMKVKNNEEYQEVVENIISKAKIPVRTILGKSTISVNDFINLQKGDIIRLNTKINDELDVYVGTINKFKALPGSASESYAVKITSILREE